MPSLVLPHIPAPRLVTTRNRTPFAHFQIDKMGPGRRFHDTVVVKGAFVLAEGVLQRAPERASMVIADDHWDATDASLASVRVAGDVVLTKPGTDVIVTGSARAPAGRATDAWDVAVAVHRDAQTLLSHALRVTGPRRWEHHALRGWTLTRPEPALEVPIRYELAYGGARQGRDGTREVYEPNPSGSGFVDVAALDTGRAYTAPQWELAAEPITGPGRDVSLAGLGPVARPWLSRRRYAGTYDDAWHEKLHRDHASGLAADYPADFDTRFFQCAHPALISSSHLRGDESIGLAGLVGGTRPLLVRLPGITVLASVRPLGSAPQERRLPLDTVHVDLDASRVYLCWRLSLDQEEQIHGAELYIEGESADV